VQPIVRLRRVVVVVTIPEGRAETVVSASAEEASDSFDAYFRGSKQPLLSMAYLLTGDMQMAQDLTQEAFLRTWSRWNRISKYDDPRAWTRRVLYNLAVSQSRRSRTRGKTFVPYRSAPPPNELHLILAAALRSLPENQVRALLLHDGAGLSVKEVATEMGAPEGTVKSWLSRGRSAAAAVLASSIGLEKEEYDD
jgi:RNA polymerase sigma-70 factor (ECF subfamily)